MLLGQGLELTDTLLMAEQVVMSEESVGLEVCDTGGVSNGIFVDIIGYNPLEVVLCSDSGLVIWEG